MKYGNLSARIDDTRDDELGQISHSFNDMLDELNLYIERVYKAEIKQKETELVALQARINPHFLYNTLEVIRMRAISQGARDVGEMIYSLSVLFKSLVQQKKNYTLKDEMEACRLYLELFRIRYKDIFTYTIQLDPVHNQHPVVKLSLQPIIENYVVHGIQTERSDNKLSIVVEEIGDVLQVEVRDNGKGIDPARLAEIREELDRPEESGQMFGLRSVHSRLRYLYGPEFGMTIESTLGEGTLIRVRYPHTEGQVFSMYNVFIVDDEPFIIEGLYDIVDWSSFGMEIVNHAGNGQAALQALSAQPVDILITDISMPIMNGLDLIREARRVQPDLKVIILSGFNEFEYLKEAMQLGIENYLLKPINVEELESTLRNTASKLDQAPAKTSYDAYGIQILKDNILHRWLTGQIATAEFEERSLFMNLTLDGPCYGIAILRTKGEEPGIFDQVQRLLADKPYVSTFHDLDGDIVMIASVDEQQVNRQMFMDCVTCLSRQISEAHPSVYIGMGAWRRAFIRHPRVTKKPSAPCSM